MTQGRCIDTEGEARCQCFPGYTGPTCSTLATPPAWGGGGGGGAAGGAARTGACSSSPCPLQALCVEKGDGFTCQCPPGTAGSFCSKPGVCYGVCFGVCVIVCVCVSVCVCVCVIVCVCVCVCVCVLWSQNDALCVIYDPLCVFACPQCW